MFHRQLRLNKRSSFFLFGSRGTGKSTLMHAFFRPREALFIDLLDPVVEDLFNRDPHELERRVSALPGSMKWVVIDEVQRAPRLLDMVHRLIESSPVRFAMTGSSARKLKRGASNLLGGRAFVHTLYPLTHVELGNAFNLQNALRWGTLPRVFQFSRAEDKILFLQSYALTYLREEVAAEQIVRNLNPFRNFLEVAAQCNGQILNYSKVAQDIGVDTKTAQSYFEILEDTLVGFRLPAFHKSVRRSQREAPKFYLFDPGVKRALERTLEHAVAPRTYAFGAAFEHFVILEILRLNDYNRANYRLSHLRTKDHAEIDLVLDRPRDPDILIEIKSTQHVTERDVASLNRFQRDIPHSRAFCFSLDPATKKIGSVRCVPWTQGIKELGL